MSDILKFLTLIGKLKATKRTGWVQRGVQSPESVSDHMYRMSIICFLLGGVTTDDTAAKLNKDHCIKLALAHDMAECIVGDLTPSDGVSKDEKHRKEKEAMEQLSELAGEQAGRELYELWEEYEYQKTPEANFVKDVDRFEMVLQAHEYESEENQPGRLQDFFDSTKRKFQHPLVKGWVDELNKTRNENIDGSK
ncbi:HD domain-containing protein 2-like [Actinia tenebrosa]|uniref:5'-deoxynucleotidase HDDC2 n=1 Tax=Actinia tenebrosa TaxID=6105 RepID=A0A6P8HJ04_ACTTE|nr:HD domain-containing protein 2-like [Actinia tenebrosa]